MILTKLPKNIANQVAKLTSDKQFQARFNNDRQLDFLQAQKHDKDIEFHQLMLLLQRKTILFGIAFKPITLALCSYLYCIQSNIIKNVQNLTNEDLDIFFYLLQTKNYTSDVKQLITKSTNYCTEKLGLGWKEIFFIFNRIYKIQFKVFSLFPRTGNLDQEVFLNVDWMFNFVSKIKPYVSYTNQELYTEVPVMQIYYYYAQWLKNNGAEGIFFRDDEEVLDQMDSRMINMVIQRLIQKGVLEKDQHKQYFDLMKEVKEIKDGK